MTDVLSVLQAHNILRPAITLRAARDAELDLAAACVLLMMESGGGRMVYGHDAVSNGGIYTPGGPVTQDNYLAYRYAVQAGRIGRQGVGDCQLTSSEFQDRGDRLGGCWDPYANQLSGFIGLASRIESRGLREGFRSYNGSGLAAERYADTAMGLYQQWHALLGGAVSEEDDLTPEEHQWLADVHAELTNREAAWGGGITDADGNPYKPFEYTLRNNVEVHQATQMLEQQQSTLAAIQDTLAEFSTDDDGELGQLSQADVNRIAASVVSLLASKFSSP